MKRGSLSNHTCKSLLCCCLHDSNEIKSHFEWSRVMIRRTQKDQIKDHELHVVICHIHSYVFALSFTH